MTNKELSTIAELDFKTNEPESTLNLLAERLRCQLRVMLKGRELALRTKFEKRITQIKTTKSQPAMKRKRSTSSSASQSEEDVGEEELTSNAKRVKGAQSHGRHTRRRSSSRSQGRRHRRRGSSSREVS